MDKPKLEEYNQYILKNKEKTAIITFDCSVFKKDQLKERIKYLTSLILNINPAESKVKYLEAIKKSFEEILKE